MTIVQSSYYGRTRRTAHALWRGSHYMLDQDDDHSWSGFCVLRLAMTITTERRREIEARAAYASLTSETQQEAVLRAIYWDSQTAVGKSRDYAGPIKVPARFVQIPVSLVQQWLEACENVPTSIRVFAHADDNLPVCSFRVETDYTQCAFEKVWQVAEGEHDELTRLWQEIWQQMGQALQTLPSMAAPEETFPRVDGDPSAYDFQAYSPTLKIS